MKNVQEIIFAVGPAAVKGWPGQFKWWDGQLLHGGPASPNHGEADGTSPGQVCENGQLPNLPITMLLSLKEKALGYRFSHVHVPGSKNKTPATTPRHPTGEGNHMEIAGSGAGPPLQGLPGLHEGPAGAGRKS